MVKRKDLALDAETDSSGARFITRASVERFRSERGADPRSRRVDGATVPLADVVRWTGRSRTELLDLVHAGILEQVPGRRSCEITAASLKAWMTATASLTTRRRREHARYLAS
jgi:hypothetical protein